MIGNDQQEIYPYGCPDMKKDSACIFRDDEAPGKFFSDIDCQPEFATEKKVGQGNVEKRLIIVYQTSRKADGQKTQDISAIPNFLHKSVDPGPVDFNCKKGERHTAPATHPYRREQEFFLPEDV